jgi:3-hydroxyacyl-CoA dehydrogenase
MKQIKKAAVLGAGVMGSTIAAHLANAGLDVVMLDIVPNQLTEEDKAKGLTAESKEFRNKIANNALNNLLLSKPAAFYSNDFAKNISVGNFEDDIHLISECDWIIEVVVENMDIKKRLFEEKVSPHIKRDDIIISTNTSGLSVNALSNFLPEALRKNFLVTHFFNPPRYMRLMEIVPCKYTSESVLKFMSDFISKRLGKGVVYAKDTPNFIGNRIGVYVIFKAFQHLVDLNLTVEEADEACGPVIGMPKTAIFKLADLVGIDTIAHIGKNSYELLKEDEERSVYNIPQFLKVMVENGLWGNKTKQGFYKKVKDNFGEKRLYYDITSNEYVELKKPKFPSVEQAKTANGVKNKIKIMVNGKDKAAEFSWRLLRDTLIYTFKRIPEISDDIVNVDNAMKWGYNWQLGPFEIFDAIGINEFIKKCENDGVNVPEGLKNIESFYKFENSKLYYYDILEKSYKEVQEKPYKIDLQILKRNNKIVEENSNASIVDIGDGVFCLEFHSKMNAISGDILNMTKKAIKRAEEDGIGLVIANQGRTFSAGANIALITAAVAEGAFDDINMMVKAFQDTCMAIKYSHIPVVAAPFNMTLGGGCEFCLHSDAINAHAETYMGLVEVGVGLLPAGGGTKEMAIRAIELAEKYNTDISPFIFKNFMNIAMAKVSNSAFELYDLGYMDDGDAVTMDIDSLIYDAKQKVIALHRNYRPKKPLTDIKAPGKSVAATIKSQLWNMKMGGFITEYEEFLGSVIADVITGGDVNPGTLISEDYLLTLEREAFVRLCSQKKTIERITYMLKNNKPLRN